MVDVEAVVRRSRAFGWFRMLQVMICGAIVLIGVAAFAAHTRAWPAIPITVAIAAGVFALFRWRLRGLVRGANRAQATLAEVAKADLDAPADVIAREGADGVEVLASSPAYARMIASRTVRFAAEGTWQGKAIELGTSIVAARDYNVMLSHVRVPGTLAIDGLFRIMSRGLATRMSRWHRPQHPVTLGDDAFDAAWVVDADLAVARRVLDADLRKALMSLHAQIPSMGTASVEVMPSGLVLRWPGAINEGWAARLRDLALVIDGRLRA